MMLLLDPLPTNCCGCIMTKYVGPSCTTCGLVLWALLKWDRGSVWLNKTSSHMLGNWYLCNISVQEWIIDPCMHSLLDGPGRGIWILTQNGENVQFKMMSWGVSMVIKGEKFPEMFLYPFSKGNEKFSFLYSEGIWGGKCYIVAAMGTSDEKDCGLFHP